MRSRKKYRRFFFATTLSGSIVIWKWAPNLYKVYPRLHHKIPTRLKRFSSSVVFFLSWRSDPDWLKSKRFSAFYTSSSQPASCSGTWWFESLTFLSILLKQICKLRQLLKRISVLFFKADNRSFSNYVDKECWPIFFKRALYSSALKCQNNVCWGVKITAESYTHLSLRKCIVYKIYEALQLL